jgi:cytochrome bd-type quinol oxidase subunit 2
VPALLLLARLFARVSVPLALAGAVGVNLLTHPILYAASAGFSSWPQLLAAEALVALVEGLALAWVWRVPLRESWPLVGAFAVNALSTLAGLALYR